MAALDRHRITWSGFLGAPGVTTMYFASGAPANVQIHAFFDAIKSYIPQDVTFHIENSGDTIDSVTGLATASWTDSTQADVVGTDSYKYSAVCGALVRWQTHTFLSGRQLRGHTYLVPLAVAGYDLAGQIDTTVGAAISAAAQALVTAMAGYGMYIWQRPRAAFPSWTDKWGHTHPAVTARSGGYADVELGSCAPKVTELRTRRD